jgi:NAD(P)-dependent dehydrogenase (short-subunit alcohol dehydrogenase family)
VLLGGDDHGYVRTEASGEKEQWEMGHELAGKVAIVTGGASGIGRAVAELFADEGAKVVVADVDAARGAELATRLGNAAAFKRTDVADAEQVRELVDFAVGTFGGLQVMCNNAGISSSFRRFLRDDLSDLQHVMAVNLYGVIHGSHAAARHMAEHGGGSIINTTSIGALTGGGPPIAYRTSKAAIIQFSRSIAVDLAEYGIRVNCIAPGHIPTEITNYDIGPVIRVHQPLQRQGSPEDVANTVLFLAGDRAAQITGIVVPVDGGTTAGAPLNQLKVLRAGIAALDED